MWRLLHICLFACLAGWSVPSLSAQERDVFVPIAKYIETGNAEGLSAWLADNLELNLNGSVNECSRNQARMILRHFFSSHTPKSFSIVHKSISPPMTYAIGMMQAGGERYRVTIFVKTQAEGNYIQHLRIEKD